MRGLLVVLLCIEASLLVQQLDATHVPQISSTTREKQRFNSNGQQNHKRSTSPYQHRPQYGRKDQYDVGFDTLPCGPLGQDIILWQEEDIAGSGTGEFVALSPNDGRLLTNGYHVDDSRQRGRGAFRVRTFVFASGLLQWVQVSNEPIQVDYEPNDDDADDDEYFNGSLQMTQRLLAVGTSRITMEQLNVTDSCGKVDVWYWAATTGRGRQFAGWVPLSTLVLPFVDNGDSKDIGGSTNSLHTYGTIFAMAEIDYQPRLAMGMPYIGPNDAAGSASIVGQVSVYDLVQYEDWRTQHWQQIGSTVRGDGPDFGRQVAFSQDGTILAVLATVQRRFDDTDCEARVYQLTSSNSSQTANWKLLGQPIGGGDEKDNNTMLCTNMVLSGDGLTLGLGPRLYSHRYDERPTGHVRMWSYSAIDSEWKRKGSSNVDGLVSLPTDRSHTFGRDLALSYNGNRLAVSASQSLLESSGPEYGIIYMLEWNETVREWQQYGWPMGTHNLEDSRLTMSNDGDTLAVGIPDGANFRGVVQPYECFGFGHHRPQKVGWKDTE